MKVVEVILLGVTVALAAGFASGLEELGMARIIAIPSGIVLSLASVAAGLYGLWKIGAK